MLGSPDCSSKLVVILVGLPARGKTFYGRKLCRYLNWLGQEAKIFSVGAYRRERFGEALSSAFFTESNEEGRRLRAESSTAALGDLLNFLHQGGRAAIFDGTNATESRRAEIKQTLDNGAAEMGFSLQFMWVEAICNDASLIAENLVEIERFSPDYRNRGNFDSLKDLKEKIALYEKIYQTIKEDGELSYVKLIDQGRQVRTNLISGFLPGKIVVFLMNLRPGNAPIFLSRHGESIFNTKGLIGGDSDLSPNGQAYGRALAEFIKTSEQFKEAPLAVWTSTLKRTLQTAAFLNLPIVQWRALVEIEVGTCDALSYAEIEAKFPEEFRARKADKLRYRYPQGESYLDVVQRLEPVIFELERQQQPVLLIVHRAVARCLLSYFCDLSPTAIPHLDVPLHTLIKLQPKAYSCEITKFPLDVPSCDRE